MKAIAMSRLAAMPCPVVDSRSNTEDKPAVQSPVETSLRWLINPVGTDVFFRNYWEQRPLVVTRNQPAYFSPLFSLSEVDRVLTTLDRRYPDVTLKNASRQVEPGEYTLADDVLDVAKIYQLFEEGSTITLAYLDTVVPALTLFCRSLEKEFSFPFQTNIYLTPPGAQGARAHYDTHDVFVLQVTGSKKWTIYGTPVESPLRGQDFDPDIHQRGAPTLEFQLDAGDVAYIPRGVVHDAHSTETISLHITAGILRYTWADLLLEFVAGACLNDPAFRKSLPPGFALPGFDTGAMEETLRNLLQQVVPKSDFQAALGRFVDEFISSCPPVLEGQMSQLAALDHLTVDSVVGARLGAIYRLQARSGDCASVECCGRKMTFPPHAGETVRFALSNPRFAVRDLPGNLDDSGRLTLIRRLIREGLVEIRFSSK
jgi:ribosomal protein L16 Arg81 hydroxylase